MWSISKVKEVARGRFQGNYWKCVLVSSVMTGLLGGITSTSANFTTTEEMDYSYAFGGEYSLVFWTAFLSSLLVMLFIGLFLGLLMDAFLYNPLYVGISHFNYKNIYKDAGVKDSMFAFDSYYRNIVSVMFARELICLAWSLLFIIPGIYKSYEYRLVPYLMAENPALGKEAALAESKRMMDGNKGKAFMMDLSFVGWYILGFLTCGVLLVFYVEPYKAMANATLYDAIKYEKGQN